MGALTEEEIRAGLARSWKRQQDGGRSPELEWDDGWIGGMAGRAMSLFDAEEVRDSELERLNEVVVAAIEPIRDQAVRAANDALVRALVQFASEYPNAPRRSR